MNQNRYRFAPSPTGPLHIGGVRTALYNYLLAKKTGGRFILRIEDTDQARYIPEAENYILNALNWLGLIPDEGPLSSTEYGPYRQSERKNLYKKYAQELVANGKAYYAFDTPEELDNMRQEYLEKGTHSQKYDHSVRLSMRNSLTLPESEVEKLIKTGKDVTIRMKVPENESIEFYDLIRGTVRFSSLELDDKILIKREGLPTYHLANIVDDRLMEISHVVRGEEWLSSTAHHVLLYKAFDWEDKMPLFAHLPLILKPNGKGKLSKRDGQKFGFPVFPLSWENQINNESFTGFKEIGFLPEAVLNFLALLGWNPGTEQELFSVQDLIKQFSVEKVVKSGARFDYQKAKWFNQQYILSKSDQELMEIAKPFFQSAGYQKSDEFLLEVCRLMKKRIETLQELALQSHYFFVAPSDYDEKLIRKKYNPALKIHIFRISENIALQFASDKLDVRAVAEKYLEENGLGFGQILPLLRMAVTGTLKGPDIFEIIALLGRDEFQSRIGNAIKRFDQII